MKIIITSLLALMSFILVGQTNNELLIFNSKGDVYLKRGKLLFATPQAEKFLPGDYIIIKYGTLTVINSGNKRVTLKETGNYSYKAVLALMGKAEASTINRYFVNVWKQMNEVGDKRVLSTGGVVRTYDIEMQDSVSFFRLFPVDSATLISEKLILIYDNPENQSCTLLFTSENQEIIKQYQTQDTIFSVNIREIVPNTPGSVYWQITAPDVPDSNRKVLFVPDSYERSRLFESFEATFDSFSNHDDWVVFLLIANYFETNKIFCVY